MITAPWKPQGAPDTEFLFDQARADKVIGFVEGACRVNTGLYAGKSMKLLDWQDDITTKLFGTVRWSEEKKTYVRQYTTCEVWIPRKNGKSVFVAALGIYLTALDVKEGNAYVIVAASTKDQASAVFRQVKAFINANPLLRKAFTVRPTVKEIEHKKSGGVLKVVAADGDTNLGSEPTAVILDEFAIQKNSELMDALVGGQGSVREPLVFKISTAGFKNKHKFGYEQWTFSKEVFDNPIVNTRTLVFMCPLPDDADWESQEVWYKANPSLGKTLSVEFFRDQYEKVKKQPSRIPWFKAYFLNIWSDSESLWIDSKAWADSGNAGGPVVEMSLEGRACFAGLDLSSTADLSSWSLLFPGSPTDASAPGYTVLTRTWGTQTSVDKRQDHMKAKLRQWSDEGWIDLSQEKRISHALIKDQILADAQKFNIKLVGYDKWNGHGISEFLEEHDLIAVDVKQSAPNLNIPTREFELSVRNQELYHGFNPVLAWNVENAVTRVDNMDRVILGKKESKDKIDAVAATINAFYVSAVKQEEEAEAGFYVWSDLLEGKK